MVYLYSNINLKSGTFISTQAVSTKTHRQVFSSNNNNNNNNNNDSTVYEGGFDALFLPSIAFETACNDVSQNNGFVKLAALMWDVTQSMQH